MSRKRQAEARTARDPGASAAPPSRPRWLDALLVFVLAYLPFANSCGNAFVYDDHEIIAENRLVAPPLRPAEIFRTSYWPEDKENGTRLYRPLTILSFAVDRALWGPGPEPVHAENIALNGLAAVLAYLLLRRLFPSALVAWFGALAWAVHPIHVEAVANGVGRSELLAGLAVLGVILLMLDATRRWTEPGSDSRQAAWLRLGLAAAVFLLGLLAKESAAMAAPLALLADWLVRERGRIAAVLPRLPAYGALAVPLGVFVALRHSVVGSGIPAPQEVMAGAAGWQRVTFAVLTLAKQVGQLVVPVHLSAEYADYRHLVRDVPAMPAVPEAILAVAGALALLVVLVRRRDAELLFGLAWFLVAILPFSNLFFPIGTVRADRLLYVPVFGLVVAAAVLLGRLAVRQATVARAVAAGACLALAARTWAGNTLWRTQDGFWQWVVRENPGSPSAWAAMGDFYRDHGQPKDAEAAYRRGIELRDSTGYFNAAAHVNLGELLGRQGDTAGAEAQYRAVVAREPSHYTAVLNLGELLLHDPNTVADAITQLERATTLRNSDFRAHANLAEAYRLSGRLDDALREIRAAETLGPDVADLWGAEAALLNALGRTDEARAAQEQYHARSGK